MRSILQKVHNMKQYQYLFPKLSRAGLGNLLMPWARCEVDHEATGIPVLAPRWTQPKIGPLLRGEKDLRYYMSLFDNSIYVKGVECAAILAIGRRLGEKSDFNKNASFFCPQIKIYSGLGNYLCGLEANKDYLGERLWQISSCHVKKQVTAQCGEIKKSIAVHIRRGDMKVSPFGAPLPNCRAVDDQWYLNVMKELRNRFGSDVNFIIFSDGTETQLERFMAVPNTRRADVCNTALTDLWLMSMAGGLVTTSTSTLSTWSAFLSSGFSVWYPGWEGKYLTQNKRQIVTDLHGLLKIGCSWIL